MNLRVCNVLPSSLYGRNIFIVLIPGPRTFGHCSLDDDGVLPIARFRRRGEEDRARPVSGLRSESQFRKSFLLYEIRAAPDARALVTVFAKREIKTRPAIVRERHRRVPFLFFLPAARRRPAYLFIYVLSFPVRRRRTIYRVPVSSVGLSLPLPPPWPFWHAPCQQFRSANTRIAPRTYTCMYITLAETIKTLNKRSPLATMAFSVSPLRLSDYTYIMCTIGTYNIHLYTWVYIITMASRYGG